MNWITAHPYWTALISFLALSMLVSFKKQSPHELTKSLIRKLNWRLTFESRQRWLRANLHRFPPGDTRDLCLLTYFDEDEIWFMQKKYPFTSSEQDLPHLKRFAAAVRRDLDRDPILNKMSSPTDKPTENERISPKTDVKDPLGVQSKLDEVIAVGSVIVAYRPKLLNVTKEQRDKLKTAISAILQANPLADLNQIQDSLGITVISVQRPQPSTNKPEKSSDW